MIENAKSFLQYRRAQEKKVLQLNDGTRPFDAVLTVEINITDLCNRRCGFCPRVDPEIYPNRNVFIAEVVLDKIIADLKLARYRGKVSFSGFGEPLLNKQFPEIIAKFRKALPDNIVETNTNGDKFTPEILVALFESGLSAIYWNLYDGPEQVATAESLITAAGVDKSKIRLRAHWSEADASSEWGLILNNRSGALSTPIKVDLPMKRSCNYPFYKLMIDWNGDVLCCSNDWLRKNVIGNVMSDNIEHIWVNEQWMKFRRNLLKSDRSQHPCATCDVDGALFGDESRKILTTFMGREP